MPKVYIVESFSLEPYENYSRPSKAFKTRQQAEEFVRQNKGRYGEGYFRWDETLEKEVPCSGDHEDAEFSYGWAYSSYISEVELVEEELLL
jgi:hypothetical protein